MDQGLVQAKIVEELYNSSDTFDKFRSDMTSYYRAIKDRSLVETLNKYQKQLIKHIIEHIKTALLPSMELLYRLDDSDVMRVRVCFPECDTQSKDEIVEYHRDGFIKVFQHLNTLDNHDIPKHLEVVAHVSLYEPDEDIFIRSASILDDDGVFKFPACGATHKIVMKSWKEHLPCYLGGVEYLDVAINLNRCKPQ